MWELILFIFAHFLIISEGGWKMQGDGVYSVIDVDKCDTEIEDAIMTFEVEKHYINHTHEVFNAKISATMDIDNTFGLVIEVCKLVDGGCKHYFSIIDNMENLLNKYAKKNLEEALRCAGLDQKNLPIPKGNYEVKDLVMDYCHMPTSDQYYGSYEAEIYFMKDDKRVGCLKTAAEFKEDDTCF
ncbi:uncharacterized protein LOC123876513 [Maniola jurtina]|uniref:uncharacterized protein LOC123876513 n=1 Tax=Maniola jurtina TaxID=191418 RepID=UPI001E68C46E|nr:uncharacterized protein LOC123876513 [Maniola jurtina]